MKKNIILTMLVSLFLAATIQAQRTTDFAGEWEIDTVRTKLPDTMRVESAKLNVSQTDEELKVQTSWTRAKGGKRAAGVQTAVYNLEGKEITADIAGAMGGKETRKATMMADGKLNLNAVRIIADDKGGGTLKINEVWELLDEYKTLKIVRYTETAGGATNAEMFFTRKTPVRTTVKGDRVMTYKGEVAPADIEQGSTTDGAMPKRISGGVLNGKARSLPAPAYPAAARAVQASGAVNVQVTIDEQGNVVSASAVSGHPLLRRAAEQAAREAKFAPTMLQGVPVSVTGVLVYNFVP